MAKKRKHSQQTSNTASKKPKLDKTSENKSAASPQRIEQEQGSRLRNEYTESDREERVSRQHKASEPRSGVESRHGKQHQTALVPPLADDASLRKSHDVHVIAVAAASKIENKVRQLLALLQGVQSQVDSSGPGSRSEKQFLIVLVARAASANKCVSVAEIAKREYLAKDGSRDRLYQYTAVWSQLESYKGKSKTTLESSEHSEGLENTADEETTRDVSEVRNTSCLGIYIALKSVHRLKELYRQDYQDVL